METRDFRIGKNARYGSPKGKGKEPVTMASKIAHSASGLAQSIAACSSTSDLAKSLSSNSKVADIGYTGERAQWHEHLPVRASSSGSRSCDPAKTSPTSSFRSTPTSEHADHEFACFLGGPCSDLDKEISRHELAWTPPTFAETANLKLPHPGDWIGDATPMEDSETERIRLRNPKTELRDVEMSDSTTENASATFEEDDEEVEETLEDADRVEAQFFMNDRDESQDLVTQTKGMDSQTLSRLKLVLGHLSEMESIAMACRQDELLSQRAFEHIVQKDLQNLAVHEAIRYKQTSYATQQVKDPQPASNQSLNIRQLQQWDHVHESMPQQQSAKGGRPVTQEDAEEDQVAPEFHCPWVRCHQRFHKPGELLHHTDSHSWFACPHEDCTAHFDRHKDWAEHITGPHHNLLDNALPMSNESNH